MRGLENHYGVRSTSSRAADAIVIAPCSADLLPALRPADEVVESLLCLGPPRTASSCCWAPPWNHEMWAHPATQRNFAQAAADGAQVLDVGQGEQACGECGDGRMRWPGRADPRHCRQLGAQAPGRAQGADDGGARTRCCRPVRKASTNYLQRWRWSLAIAAAARAAGAQVTLVAGPVHLPTPRGAASMCTRATCRQRCSRRQRMFLFS